MQILLLTIASILCILYTTKHALSQSWKGLGMFMFYMIALSYFLVPTLAFLIGE